MWWPPTAATFVVAMNRVDVVELVVDLVDVDLDVDLVDVDLDIDLVDVDLDVVPFCGCCLAGVLVLEKLSFFVLFDFPQVAKNDHLLRFEPREYASRLSFEKCCRMH